MDSNQAEIASIGEEMDENFLFNDSDSLNRSVTSLASLASSADSAKQRPNSSSGSKTGRGFTISRFWNRKSKDHGSDHSCPCPDCSNKILSSTVAAVPKIKCHIISEPGTPVSQQGGVASSWTYGYQIPLKHNSSFCSVDEEDDNQHSPPINPSENQLRPHSPSNKSRLSLNLVGKNGASPKSPRKLSKFLRSSFSKLLQLSNSNNPESNNVESPTSSLRSSQSLDPVESPAEIQQTGEYNLMSPTTLAYLEEAKMSGLPVIPFAYPTCVLVDKMKNKEVIEMSKKEAKNKAALRDIDDEMMPKSPPGTLESIVDIAQREYRKEQPEDLELDADDFFCGSVGSVSTLSETNNNHHHRPRSRIVQANWDQAEIDASSVYDFDGGPKKWHDYIDMSHHNKYSVTTNIAAHRSEPIRIKDKQY